MDINWPSPLTLNTLLVFAAIVRHFLFSLLSFLKQRLTKLKSGGEIWLIPSIPYMQKVEACIYVQTLLMLGRLLTSFQGSSLSNFIILINITNLSPIQYHIDRLNKSVKLIDTSMKLESWNLRIHTGCSTQKRSQYLV